MAAAGYSPVLFGLYLMNIFIKFLEKMEENKNLFKKFGLFAALVLLLFLNSEKGPSHKN